MIVKIKDEFKIKVRVIRVNSTALHDAAERGHMEVVSLLLDRGANIQADNVSQ